MKHVIIVSTYEGIGKWADHHVEVTKEEYDAVNMRGGPAMSDETMLKLPSPTTWFNIRLEKQS